MSGKDGQAGRLARQVEGPLARVRARLALFRVKKEYATTFWLEGSTSPRPRLLALPAGEIDLAQTRDIMRQVQQLPGDQLGQVMTAVSALGSRPERLLRNLDASPGELRKVLLALGVARRPHLIVMDEPTNHLDLPAIESLESVLRDCPCGLFLASHDARFLAATTRTRWNLRQEGAVVRLRTDRA